MPILSPHGIQTAQHWRPPFIKGYHNTQVAWEGWQQPWREGGGRKRKEEEAEEASYLNHKTHSQPKCLSLGIPRNKTTAFLSYYYVLSAPETQPCQVEKGRSRPAPQRGESHPGPGNPRARGCKHRTAQGDGTGNGAGTGQGGTKATSPRCPWRMLLGELTLTVPQEAPPKNSSRPGTIKHNACGVKNTKKNKVFILKQMKRIQFLLT